MKTYYKNAHQKLRQKINDLLEIESSKFDEELMKIIIKYQRTKKISKKDADYIKELIYKLLEEVYKLTSAELRVIYKHIQKLDVENILELVFKKDGKKLEERIDEYLEELVEDYEYYYSEINSSSEAISLTFSTLQPKFKRIIVTESYNMESAVKKLKKPNRPSMLIIEAGCGDLCQGGEYAADENVDLPPFHPNCQCIWYFDETDDSDDIEDLELEVEEQ